MSGNGVGFVHGYVLAGGQSSRMGRDKAMLEFDGTTMLRRTCDLLARVCGAATVVGPAARYASLGLPLIEDARQGCGPLAGVEAALADCATKGGVEWAMIVACDMPRLEEAGLLALLDDTGRAGEAQVVLPVSDGGLREPLCALYRPGALGVVRKQLETGKFKLLDAMAQLSVRELVLDRPHHFTNVNRPEDWEALHVRG